MLNICNERDNSARDSISISSIGRFFARAGSFYAEPFSSPAEWKLMDAELMQKRFPVGFGPSSNTCPRCASHFEQVTSVRTLSGFAISSSRLPPTSWASYDRRGARFSVEFVFSVMKRVVKWW